jgi:imidazolonepropionase
VVSTYLGAHALPPERVRDREGYLALVAQEMVPRVAQLGLADFADAYLDEGAFGADEVRRVLSAARAAGLGVKVHADQLGSGGGAELAAELGAVSADHLERISEAGVAALARAGTVAVTLPVAALWLGGPAAPARRLLEAGVPVAVATDFNPGTAPTYHLPLAMTLACVAQRMTPAEALKGATLCAARALGLEERVGSLEPGKAADFAVVDAESPAQWLYHFRPNACVLTVASGAVAWRAGP